jgi:spermidine synthase
MVSGRGRFNNGGSRSAVPIRALITLFFLLSGATALVYQVIWVRALGLVVGQSVLAVSAVVATYMAGLGLGARLAGRRAAALGRPLAAYGALEAAIGLYALASPLIFSALQALAPPAGGGLQVGLTLLVAALALSPPTLAMGATLPLLTAWYARDPRTLGRDMGWLYAINTTGAFLGAALAGFWLLPSLGQPLSLRAAAAVNLATPGGVGEVGADGAPLSAPGRPRAPGSEAPLSPAHRRAVLAAFALSGCAAMINQVAWSRSFSLFTGSTTYAFSLIVAAFIAGLALGGHLLSRRVDHSADRVALLAALNLGVALSAALIIPILGELPLWLLEPLAARAGSFGETQRFIFGVLAALVAVPTVLMGGAYPVATRALADSAADAPIQVGRAYAWNTAGAIVGSLSAGLLLIPLLSLRGALWLAVCVNLLAAAVLLVDRRRVALALPLVGAAAWALSPGWNPRHMNLAPHIYARDLTAAPAKLAEYRDSGSLRFHREGVGATVTVLQRSSGAMVMRVNGKTDASTEADQLTQALLGGLPMVLARELDEALIIGLGSGMTLASALQFPVGRVQVAELLPEVVDGARAFGPPLGEPLGDPRVELVIGDGRHLVARGGRTYDVISSQPTNLFIAGMSGLFTLETFQAMRDALEPGGVALVWIQGYLLLEEDFKTIARTFQAAFPEAHLWSATPYDLVFTGHLEPLSLDPARVAERMAAGGAALGWRAPEDLQRHYLLGPEALAALAGPGPLHTDADPFLEFTAPRALYDDAALLDAPALSLRRQLLPLAGAPAAALEARRAAALAVEAAALAGGPGPLERALEGDEGNPLGIQQLAIQLHAAALAAAREGALDDALETALRAAELDPQALLTWRLVARIYQAMGSPELAVEALSGARALQPWNPYASLYLAEALAAAGPALEARQALSDAIALDPELPELLNP